MQEPVVPADDNHDDEEDAGDGDGDEEHYEGRHTGSGSTKVDSVLAEYEFVLVTNTNILKIYQETRIP